MNQLRLLPNLLTLLRICLAPFLVVAVLEGRFHTAFILFVIAGVSDAFDGWAARILKQRSRLGEYLDPVADKLLLSTLFLVLTHLGLMPMRVTVLVFSRDLGILIVAAILYAASGMRDFQPSFLGKANTLVQIAAVSLVILRQVSESLWVQMARDVALDLTIALTILSGLHYSWRVVRGSGASSL